LNSFEDQILVRRGNFRFAAPKISQEEKSMNVELQSNMKKLCKDLMIIE